MNVEKLGGNTAVYGVKVDIVYKLNNSKNNSKADRRTRKQTTYL